MTIDEAIRFLSDHQELILVYKNPELRTAVSLGIEALKEVKRLHTFKAWFLRKLLPGETEK